jgi:small subunit ribosomal protein S17e
LGKVRTDSIKRLAEELVDRYPSNFGNDYEVNKIFLNSLGVKITKKMRNKVVGYVTQLKNIETRVSQEPLEREVPPAEPQP